jgi:hypothetical protein
MFVVAWDCKYPWFALYFLLTGLPTWNRVHLEKLKVTQVPNKSPTFYGSRRFITVFTKVQHVPILTRCLQSTTFHPISLRSILILSSHLRLGLPSFFSLQVFRPKFCTHFSHACYVPRKSPYFISVVTIFQRNCTTISSELIVFVTGGDLELHFRRLITQPDV